MTTPGSVTHDGRVYFSVGEAARELSTTATKIRQMMGRGDLDWTQLRVGGRIFVPADSILASKRRLIDSRSQ
jgi:hypothetical protein